MRIDSTGVAVQRYDTASLGGRSYERTPQGGIRARGRFTRSGVLEYDLPDGTKRREWRPPEEVFAPESYHTLHDAPITIHHPDEGEVDASSYQRETVGHICGDVAPEGNEFLGGTVVIQDESAVRMALGGNLTEFSAGYLSVLQMTAGFVPEGMPDAGQPYDCIQRRIKYNHVAFLPPGLGRAGPDVSLRLDSAGNQLGPLEKDPIMLTEEELAGLRALLAMAPKLTALVAAPPPVAPVAPVAAVAPTTDNQPPTEAAPVEEPKRDNEGELEEEQKTDSHGKGLSPEEQERLVLDSIELRDQARQVLGAAYQFRGKTNRQVMADVVKHVDAAFELGQRSEDYLRGRYESALTQHAEIERMKQHSSLRTLHTDSTDDEFADDNSWLQKKISG